MLNNKNRNVICMGIDYTKTLKTLVVLFGVLLGLALSGCSLHKNEEEQISECVDSFAVNYFNWHYAQASKYCSTDSKRWLQFVASQVTKDDLEMLRNKQTALSVEIENIDLQSEKQAIVGICVDNYIAPRSFAAALQEVERGYFELIVIKLDKRWVVKMEALPRSEKQNHD